MGTGTAKQAFLSFFIIMITVAAIQGCKKPEEGSKSPFNITYNLQKTRFTIRFIDAKTGQLIGGSGDKSVSVKVSGTDKDAVYDIAGLKKDIYRSKHGFITLALAPEEGHIPSAGQPVRFSLIASCAGYLPAAKTVSLTKEGAYQLRIAMIKTGDLPESAAKVLKQGVGRINDSTLVSPLTVVTPGIEVKLVIPSGCALLDRNREPLKSPLSVSIVYFNNKSEQCLAAFPGGLAASVYQNGTITDGTFFTAGYLWIQITGSEGKTAAIFEKKEATLEMLIDKNTINSETGVPVAAGDLVGVYRFVSDSGVWQKEAVDTIEAYNEIPPVGDFVVKTKISAPFYHTFSWFWQNNCYNGTYVTFTADSSSQSKGYLQGIIKRKSDSAYIGWFGGIASPEDTVQLPFVPASVPAFIRWENDSASTVTVTGPYIFSDVDDLCNGNNLEIPLAAAGENNLPVTVSMTAHCPANPTVNILPSFGIWYRPESSFSWNWADQKEGISEIYGLTEGANYVIGIYFDNDWKEWTITVDNSRKIELSFDFSSNICSNVFGM